MQRVGIFDVEVCVQQLVLILVRIRRRRRSEAEVNRLLVARHNGIGCPISPTALTLKTELVLVPGKRGVHVGGEEQRYDLSNHRSN